MRNVLFVDCCIREKQSRTRDLAQAFLSSLPADCEVTHLAFLYPTGLALPAELVKKVGTAPKAAVVSVGRQGRAKAFAQVRDELTADRAVLVADVSGEEPIYYELINPEIVEQEGEQIGPEGCLSLPNIWGIVTRPEKVKVKAFDRNGQPFELEAEGLLARACCHEIDHLNGILFDSIADRFLSEEEIEEMSE